MKNKYLEKFKETHLYKASKVIPFERDIFPLAKYNLEAFVAGHIFEQDNLWLQVAYGALTLYDLRKDLIGRKRTNDIEKELIDFQNENWELLS